MLVVLLQIIFVLACFLLVVAVLLQSGKGGGVSGAFGIGGASQTLFGASGAGDVLTKATWILGGTFMLFSLLLAMLSGSSSSARRSVLQPAGAVTAPVTPGATPPADGGSGLPAATDPAAGTTPVPGSVAPPAGSGAATGGSAPGATGGTGQ